MAKYDVTYACGHTETVELFGKTSERERKIEWMEGNCLCPSCYKEKQQKEAAAFDLPALTGTPKQVAWAETLRNGVFEKLEFEKLARGKNPTDEFLAWLKDQTESRFWIDNKGASIAFLEKKWKNKKEETKLEGTPKQIALTGSGSTRLTLRHRQRPLSATRPTIRVVSTTSLQH